MANLSFSGLPPWLLQGFVLDLNLSPPAVSESAVVDLSLEIAAGAESRAGLGLLLPPLLMLSPAPAVRSKPGSRSEVERHQRRGGIVGGKRKKWRPQTDPAAKMARVKRGRAVQQRGEDEEQLTHAVSEFGCGGNL